VVKTSSTSAGAIFIIIVVICSRRSGGVISAVKPRRCSALKRVDALHAAADACNELVA